MIVHDYRVFELTHVVKPIMKENTIEFPLTLWK